MKIELNKPVTDLDGKEIEHTNMAKTLASSLASSNAGDPLKMMYWATKLHNGESLDLDPTDTTILKEFITSNQTFTNLLKTRILENIE